jgi:signal transduction histidine kinase
MQLTAMMLAYLTPVAIAYTVVASHSAAQHFSRDLKAEARIAQRSLNASLPPDVEQSKWENVRYASLAISRADLLVAFDESCRRRLTAQRLPIPVPALIWTSARIESAGAAEFMRRADGRWWFCRIEPLGKGGRGYLLPAQDWTMRRGDRYPGITPSLLTNLGFLLAGTVGILLLASRYAARLLNELHKHVEKLCDSEASGGSPDGWKVEFISGKFGRLIELLAEARCRLRQGSERKWQLERHKLNADKLAAIATLTSGFAHGIGTPLGVVRGLAEMLLSGTFEQSEITENLEIIIRQTDQISRMVRGLVDLGRSRSAMRVTLDVRAIADRTIQLLKPEAVRRRVEVITNLGPRPLMVDCDPDRLHQVFANLETNALDAMAGGGQLRVNSVADEVHGRVRLSFEDTGPGVPTAIRDRIFDPFFTTKDVGQSNGIGLTISQTVIADHGGELTLEPHTRGACFVVTLPLRERSNWDAHPGEK